nr:hypothetical protein [Herpetosiphonaceae bacterium]
MSQFQITTLLHENSVLATARRALEATAAKVEQTGELLAQMEGERQEASVRLAALEARPVDLKVKFDRDLELEISSLRRGVGQFDQRIKATQSEHDRQVRIKATQFNVVHALEARLWKAEHDAAILADM